MKVRKKRTHVTSALRGGEQNAHAILFTRHGVAVGPIRTEVSVPPESPDLEGGFAAALSELSRFSHDESSKYSARLQRLSRQPADVVRGRAAFRVPATVRRRPRTGESGLRFYQHRLFRGFLSSKPAS